jgi:aspartate kinase
MIEMAVLGAGVLHPRCVELAEQFNVPLRVRNSLNNSEGTIVTTQKQKQEGPKEGGLKGAGPKEEGMEEFDIVGVTSDSGKFLMTVALKPPGELGAIWDRAIRAHLPIIVPVFSHRKVHFFSDRDGEKEWQKNLQVLVGEGLIEEFELDFDTIPLSLVGRRFSQDGNALQQVIEVLSQAHISIKFAVVSPLSMTIGIPFQKEEEGVKALHAAFLEVTS